MKQIKHKITGLPVTPKDFQLSVLQCSKQGIDIVY